MQQSSAGQVVSRLTRAVSALLASPRTTGEWSEQSVNALRDLVRARQAALLLASDNEQRVFGDQHAGAVLRQLPAVHPASADGAERGRSAKVEVRPAGPLAPAHASEHSKVTFHVVGDDRISAVGLVSTLEDRHAVVGIYCTFLQPVSNGVASARLALLDVARPALESAARERLTRRAELGAVRRTLHAFESAAAIFTADGTLLDANNAAVGLLAAERGDGALNRSMMQAALSARSTDAITDPVEVRCGAQSYRLRACTLGSATPGDRSVLVLVDRVAAGAVPALVADVELLRERFHLTEREQEVARLLCLGQSNVAIAEALGISPNTARHHTERVLMKLSIRSRAAIHRVLMEVQRDAARALPVGTDRREASPLVVLPRSRDYASSASTGTPAARAASRSAPRAD